MRVIKTSKIKITTAREAAAARVAVTTAAKEHATATAAALVLLVIAVLEVHHVDQERRRNQQNALVQRRAGREQNGERVRVRELRLTRPRQPHQLSRPGVPASLDMAFRAGAIIRDIIHDSTFHPQNARLLVAGAEGREAELARLQTAAVDVHALLAVLIGDREHVVAAVEVVLHQAAALLVRVQNVHLGRVQAED